jgi:hypothetical protein
MQCMDMNTIIKMPCKPLLSAEYAIVYSNTDVKLTFVVFFVDFSYTPATSVSG